MFHAFLMQGQSEVVVVHQIKTLFVTKDDGYHVVSEEVGSLFLTDGGPLPPLVLHLAQTDCHLRWFE
ncbi:hypothetical protein D3C71_1696120 [compost metagenome]